jgi:hypothetical protein
MRSIADECIMHMWCICIFYLQVEETQIIQDLTYPSVTSSPEDVKSRISIYKDAYSATKNTHAIVLCTEWDEFIVIILFNNLWFCSEVFWSILWSIFIDLLINFYFNLKYNYYKFY